MHRESPEVNAIIFKNLIVKKCSPYALKKFGTNPIKQQSA